MNMLNKLILACILLDINLVFSRSDICDGISCPPFHICNEGACYCNDISCLIPVPEISLSTDCEKTRCPSGSECVQGKCLKRLSCKDMVCPPLYRCKEGVCCDGENCGHSLIDLNQTKSACTDVKCPSLHDCVEGVCICFDEACSANVSARADEVATAAVAAVTSTTQGKACSSNPCRNGCQCIESCRHEGGYYCKSTGKFLGKTCQLDSPIVECLPEKISVSVSATLLDQLFHSDGLACIYIGGNVGNLTVDRERCRACIERNGTYSIELSLPFQSCGTSMRSDLQGSIVFSNHLWANLIGDQYEIPIPIMKFQCFYNQEYSIFTSIKPALEVERLSISEKINLRGTMELCKIATACPSSCPSLYSVTAGAAYTIAETIHVILSTRQLAVNTGRFWLSDFYLACSPSKLHTSIVSLVSNGCELSRLSTSVDRSRSTKNVVCVSFKVPRLNCSDNLFYIHAKLQLIMESNVPDCSRSISGLKKRSLHSDNNIDYIEFGPIYYVSGSPGKSNLSLLLQNDFLPRLTDSAKPFNTTIVFSITAIVAFVSLLLFVAAIVARVRR